MGRRPVRGYEQGAAEFSTGLRVIARNHAVTPVSDVALARQDLDRLRRLVADVVELTPQGRRVKRRR